MPKKPNDVGSADDVRTCETELPAADAGTAAAASEATVLDDEPFALLTPAAGAATVDVTTAVARVLGIGSISCNRRKVGSNTQRRSRASSAITDDRLV
jgi:hypothetical protein